MGSFGFIGLWNLKAGLEFHRLNAKISFQELSLIDQKSAAAELARIPDPVPQGTSV
jgi:hypothetical protein